MTEVKLEKDGHVSTTQGPLLKSNELPFKFDSIHRTVHGLNSA